MTACGRWRRSTIPSSPCCSGRWRPPWPSCTRKHCRGLRLDPDDRGQPGERPPGAGLERAVRSRAGSQISCSIQWWFDALVPSRCSHAGVHPRHARHLDVLERERPARLQRGLLHTQPDDADVHLAETVRPAEGVPCCGRSADDRSGRGRGCRRTRWSTASSPSGTSVSDPSPWWRRDWRMLGGRGGLRDLSDLHRDRRTEERDVRRRHAVRQQIVFYGSTPAYRGVLDLHGWVTSRRLALARSRPVGDDGGPHRRR